MGSPRSRAKRSRSEIRTPRETILAPRGAPARSVDSGPAPGESIPSPMQSPRRYITPEGYRRLAAEHARIWTVERPRIVAEVEAAAALGDRSENAEYIYGKKKLRELDRRLRFLATRMDELTVVEPGPHPSGRAYFGAWVVVETDEGEERLYRLVGPDEADAGQA